MAKFKGKLVTWGNSVGVSLPKPVRDSLNLEAGDEVDDRRYRRFNYYSEVEMKKKTIWKFRVYS